MYFSNICCYSTLGNSSECRPTLITDICGYKMSPSDSKLDQSWAGGLVVISFSSSLLTGDGVLGKVCFANNFVVKDQSFQSVLLRS